MPRHRGPAGRILAALAILVLPLVLPLAFGPAGTLSADSVANASADSSGRVPARSAGTSDPVPGTEDPFPPVTTPITVNDFLPADRDLSDCLSVLPKPGCGSEARGGPAQAAVFGAVVFGVGVVIARIVWSTRRRSSPT